MGFLLSAHGIENNAYLSGLDILDRAELDRGIILLDLRMDDLNGLEVLRRLGKRKCPLPVIVISGHGNIGDAVAAMKLGAIDFLEKPFAPDALIACLERAFEIGASSAEHLLSQAAATAKVSALTPRQGQILQGMVAGQSNKMMARHLGLSPRTVESHRSQMLDRLGVSNISDAIRLANQAGVSPSCPEAERRKPVFTQAAPSVATQLELQWSGAGGGPPVPGS